MTRLNERIETPLPAEEAFAYLADFGNSVEWDPGVAEAARLDGDTVRVGARYQLGIRRGDRVAPMQYRVVAYEPPRRVVLEGSGSGVRAVDEIVVEPSPEGGSIVDYTAEIRLEGVLRLVQPVLGRTFRKIAADASDGIRSTLTARAAARRGTAG